MIVTGKDDKQIVDQAISLPKSIVCDDGRELLIRNWLADVPMNDVVVVTIEAIVSVPNEKE